MGSIVSNTIKTPHEMNNSYKELSSDLFSGGAIVLRYTGAVPVAICYTIPKIKRITVQYIQ